MSGRFGTATRIGAFAALALLLTGCIKLNMNLGINDDNTVSGTIQFGVSKQLLELSGQNAQDLLGSDSPFPSDAPGVKVEPFDDGTFAGQQFTFESVPLQEFNSGGFAGATGLSGVSGVTGSNDALNIQRQGDTFVVTGVLDLSSGLSGATGPLGGSAADLFKSADIKIAFTFPGEVIQAPGGKVEGNTVTYVPKFGERLEINATGSAVDNGQAADVTGGGGSSNLLLYIIIGAAIVVLLVVLFLVLRGRKGRGGGPESGFGEGEPAATTSPVAGPAATQLPETDTPTATPPPAPPMPPPPPGAEG